MTTTAMLRRRRGGYRSRYRFAILATPEPATWRLWAAACAHHEVEYDILDLLQADWLERVLEGSYDCLLVRPDARLRRLKEMYDERLHILAEVLDQWLYPTCSELRLYENKRLQAYWLKANRVPHPTTHVFYDAPEAEAFIAGADLPIVGKTSLGAAGSGVRVLRSRAEARAYVRSAFSRCGIRRRLGPNRMRGGIAGRGWRVLRFGRFRERLANYLQVYGDAQRGHVILQEFIPHDFEWRVVKIGPSHFAHKKLPANGMASGTKLKDYSDPPLEVLDFVRALCDRHGFLSQAVDLLPGPDGTLLVNELQTIFGQSDPYQMLVNGRPGRYRHVDGSWHFEAGDFNARECFDLRLEHAMALLDAARAAAVPLTPVPLT